MNRRANWATIVGVPIAVVSVVVAFVALGGDSSRSQSEASSAADLRKVDLVVRNERWGEPVPRLEVTLHNFGGRTAVVNRVRIEIERVASLPLCYTQGDLPLNHRYRVTIPVDAKAGDVVEAPLSQQLGPDEPDRFAIALGLGGPEGEELPGVYVFALDVSLVNDVGPPLQVGRALVSLPGLPWADVYFWDKGTAEWLESSYNAAGRPSREVWPEATVDCWRSNTDALRQMLSMPGRRSPELGSIAPTLAEPSYQALEEAIG